MTPTRFTFTDETALLLSRAAEAVKMTPEALAERVLRDFLQSCDWGVMAHERESADYRMADWRVAILEATEEDAP
jgi:hypothetical protein